MTLSSSPLFSHTRLDRERASGVRRSKWRRVLQSLQFKASFLVVLLILVITGSGVFLSLRATSSLYIKNEAARTREWAQSVAAATSVFVEPPDRESLAHIVNDLVRIHHVAYAAFTDPSGELLAFADVSTGSRPATSSPDRQAFKDYLSSQSGTVWHEESGVTVVNVVVPICASTSPATNERATAKVLGRLHFGYDVTATQAGVHAMGTHLWRLAIGAMILAIPCSLFAMRRVVAPLEELTKTARAIAAGALDARADMSSEDEIGELARSFNEMTDRLAASQMELLEVNVELENRVQQRTRELEDLAARDPLTGLYNRRHFGEEVAREFAAAQRYDSDLTCLMFDLDHFKQINDQFGHRMGDEVLMLLANAIASELRESDIAARFGGDEFILLLPRTSSSAAQALADRVVAAFKQEVSKRFSALCVSLSVGVASLRATRAVSAETLIQQADFALYAAKERGRNCTVTAPCAVGAN